MEKGEPGERDGHRAAGAAGSLPRQASGHPRRNCSQEERHCTILIKFIQSILKISST